jgi:hypothetical protein
MVIKITPQKTLTLISSQDLIKIKGGTVCSTTLDSALNIIR